MESFQENTKPSPNDEGDDEGKVDPSKEFTFIAPNRYLFPGADTSDSDQVAKSQKMMEALMKDMKITKSEGGGEEQDSKGIKQD